MSELVHIHKRVLFDVKFEFFFRFPVWASKVLDDIKFQAFKHKSSTATPQLARLEIGFLLREIFDNFNRKKDRNERKTFVLYSAKDLTIVNILNALGIFDVRFDN